ncbi:MAG: hypothetical protein ABIJ31_11515 [Pseudomonadota bacterium]
MAGIERNGEKRFGTIAIEMGYIKQEQLIAALKQQVSEETQNGLHRKVGNILYEMGAMDTQQIKSVLTKLHHGFTELI